MAKRVMVYCALFSFFLSFNLKSVSAIEYVFPAASGVVDITKAPYSADRTGKTDVSAILTKAANDLIDGSGWDPGVLYLPNGTYLVKNTFSYRLAAHGNGCGPHLIGQSRHGTVIKLAKGTWPLGTELKPVIQTGAGDENNFSKAIKNLTVLVDSNNAGAIGIVYVSDNNGMMSDVDVISADGKGQYGIQSAGNWVGSTVSGNGPFIIRRTYIKGFQVGFRGCATEGEMMSQIRLEGQTKYGLWVGCGDLFIDSLWSNDTCIAVEAEAPVVLTHALLTGGSPTAYGIRNFSNASYFSDVVTTGYKFAISSVGLTRPPLVSSFKEYAPTPIKPLFATAKTGMNLPTKYPPVQAWESDMTKWAFPADYKTGGRTDVQALQAAIDDATKTTVCLPWNTVLQIDAPVYVRGAIKRIYGTGGRLHKVNSNGTLIIDNGTAPLVMIEKLSIDNVDGTPTPDIHLYKRTTRTLVLETLGMIDLHIEGGGETYITDMTSGRNYIDHAQAKVWMWQWEGFCCGDSTLVVKNGMVRAYGGYDEGNGSMVYLLGGITEILGFWEYSTSCGNNNSYILTIGGAAQVSAAGIIQQNFCNPWGGYNSLIKETRGGTTKILAGTTGYGDSLNLSGGNISLYTSYDSAQVAQALQSAVSMTLPKADNSAAVSFMQKPAGIEIRYGTASAGPVTLVAYDLAGRTIAVVKDHPMTAGMHRTMMPKIAGVACVQVRTQGATASLRMIAHAK